MKKGFTLIELIVTITILMILLGVTLASYTSYNDNQKVKQAALTLKSDLRMARTNAVSGKKPVSCDTLETFQGYKISFTSNAYTIIPVCNMVDIDAEKVSATLPQGVYFNEIPDTFTYYPLTQGTSLSTARDYRFVLTNGTYTITLLLDPATGDVSDGV